jgi:hypothetical protein
VNHQQFKVSKFQEVQSKNGQIVGPPWAGAYLDNNLTISFLNSPFFIAMQDCDEAKDAPKRQGGVAVGKDGEGAPSFPSRQDPR